MEMSEEIAGKRVVSCRDVLGEDKGCEFAAIGREDDEVFNMMVEHLQKEHDTTIPPGSHLDSVIRKSIHILHKF
jgi:predicted small metal-binding protein